MKLLLKHVLVILFVIPTVILSMSGLAEEETSNKSNSQYRLKQLGSALQMYTQDYDDVLPPMKDFATIRPLLKPYLKDESAFVNPDTNQPFVPNPSLSMRHLTNVYEQSYEEKHDIIAFYSIAPKAKDRHALLLPRPAGRNKEGVLIWQGAENDISWDSTGRVHPSYPAFKVARISSRNWSQMKKASKIP